MRRRRTPVPGRDGYLRAWSVTHGGYDPATGGVLVRRWLGLTYLFARPLAALGTPPAAVTAVAAALPALAMAPAAAGGRWPLLAAVIVLASAVLDSLDGAVAVLRDRVSPVGFVLDSVADRVADTLYLVVLWLLGAPGWLAVAAGAGLFLLEYTRARAGNAGFGEIGVVTVGERPTRVILTVAGLLAAGVLPALREPVAAVTTAAVLAVAAVGLGQLAAVLRRVLRGR
ncbi:CDP-alcohol phosphatidyltransferase family protein [Frankia sp. AgW1.1]|uniref:CDP-alcohol phosphatidyltransferase family protein n=1 Tax=Frankia sp. AgW1.1 TaxID=1836971 RepID=UPI001931F035|nr:CDP-alcohol phosphatidyltransferase family protein [Frankia sp. AgW1.1]MBL7488720.1 CDP-alcohol phosphatidyltransferase family protein [Frankia sp. AgW1.1]